MKARLLLCHIKHIDMSNENIIILHTEKHTFCQETIDPICVTINDINECLKNSEDEISILSHMLTSD